MAATAIQNPYNLSSTIINIHLTLDTYEDMAVLRDIIALNSF